jgi:hypothetical protein
LEEESRTRGTSKSNIVRERLELSQSPHALDGRLEEILTGSWEAELPSKPSAVRSAKKQRLAQAIRAKKLHR